MAINRLQAVLDRAGRTKPEPKKSKASVPKQRPPGRNGKPIVAKEPGTVLVGAHLPPSYLRQLRLLAAEDGITSNTLIREALDLLFVKKGRDRIRR